MEQSEIRLRPSGAYILLVNMKYFVVLILLRVIMLYLPENIDQYLLYLVPIPILMLCYNMAYWYMIRYRISKDQLIVRKGVFNLKTDYLELYRVKDLEMQQNIIMRVFKIMIIKLNTSDHTHPLLELKGIKYSNLAEVLRELVLIARKKYRVYEVD